MDTDRIFKRKIYDSLLKWKETSNGKSALLVQGARRIGKSTIVEEFAKREYDSYILIDFTKCSQEVLDLFNDVSDLNYIFLRLQLIYHVQLKERKSPPVLLIKVFSYHDKSKNLRHIQSHGRGNSLLRPQHGRSETEYEAEGKAYSNKFKRLFAALPQSFFQETPQVDMSDSV